MANTDCMCRRERQVECDGCCSCSYTLIPPGKGQHAPSPRKSRRTQHLAGCEANLRRLKFDTNRTYRTYKSLFSSDPSELPK